MLQCWNAQEVHSGALSLLTTMYLCPWKQKRLTQNSSQPAAAAVDLRLSGVLLITLKNKRLKRLFWNDIIQASANLIRPKADYGRQSKPPSPFSPSSWLMVSFFFFFKFNQVCLTNTVIVVRVSVWGWAVSDRRPFSWGSSLCHHK